jgi:hypothetical protein
LIAGRVCAALYAADTRPLTLPQLVAQLGHARNTVAAGLVTLRGAMDPGGLISDGRRYALTEAGMDDCNAALADARARGVAA